MQKVSLSKALNLSSSKYIFNFVGAFVHDKCTDNHIQAMKKIIFISLFLFFHPFMFSQEISVLDKITGGNLTDFFITDEMERGYLLFEVYDSIWLNDQLVYIDTINGPDPSIKGQSFLYVNTDGTLKYAKNMGWSGGKLLLMDSSFLLVIGFIADTLFMGDTSFIKIGPGPANNVVALEYNLKEGELLRFKHWPAEFGSKFGPDNMRKVGDDLYMVGPYGNGTLVLDGQVATTFGGSGLSDAFVAKFDDSLKCQWIKSVGGYGSDFLYASDIAENGQTLLTGQFLGNELYCDDEFVLNPLSPAANHVWVASVDEDGGCKWVRQIVDYFSSGGSGAGFLSDGSAVVTGNYYGQEADFGSIVLSNPATTSTGFLAKYAPNGAPVFAVQLEGASEQGVSSLAVTSNDGIWIGGSYLSDTMSIGGFDLLKMGMERNAFIAKYDQYGEPLFAFPFWGNSYVYARRVWTGPDEKLFAEIWMRNDSLYIGDSLVVINESRPDHSIIIQIDDVISKVEELEPSLIAIKIYPNPVSNNQINYEITAPENFDFQQIKLYSIYGESISEYKINDKKGQVNLPYLSPGIYLIKFENKNGTRQVQKLVVE